jgi:hypothetical protein
LVAAPLLPVVLMYGGRPLASFAETWAMTAILHFGMYWSRFGTQHRWQ